MNFLTVPLAARANSSTGIASLTSPRASSKLLSAVLAAGVCLASAAPAHAIDRKERTKERSGTYSTSDGKSGTIETSVTKDDDQVDREQKVTNQNGKTVTRDANRARDKANKSVTGTSTTTGPNGKTATTTSTSKLQDDGTVGTTGTRTGFNGKTSTFDATTAKTENGRTTTGTVTNAQGKTSTYGATATHGNGEAVKTQTVTGPNGKTTERVIDTKKNPDGTFTRTIQVTAPDGTTSTRTETVTITPTGKP